jgi:tetratricopeptide (TPR) repeat protein
MADRYSYLPSVGLWIMVAWGVRDWLAGQAWARATAALGGTAAVIACMVLTPRQVGYWRSTEELFKRTTTLADEQYRIGYNLGCKAIQQGDYPGAIREFQQALSTEVEMPLLIDHSRAYNDLGYAYLHEGQIANAVTNFQIAILIKPHYAEAHYNLGRALLLNHQPKEAVNCFFSAVAEDPGVAETHCKLANTLVLLDRHAEAIAEYSQALRLLPGMDEAANNLAWLLATCPDRSLRDGVRAVALARQASQRSRDQNPVILGTLAAAYAEAGNLPEAVATAQRAHQLALAQNNRSYAGVLESQLETYRAGAGAPHP